MLITTAILTLLLVSGFIIKYYPKSKKQTETGKYKYPPIVFDEQPTCETPTEDLAPEVTPETVVPVSKVNTKDKSTGGIVKMGAKKKPTEKAKPGRPKSTTKTKK